ncbi:MAG: hypothetical protein IKW76_09005, partial [Clostridia bacterium]|nr:hypothetical protein [Clostridia bacterium]
MRNRLPRILTAVLLLIAVGFSVFAEGGTARQASGDVLIGTYTFTVYGWGHGVGLSQMGALTFGDSAGRYNWNYVQILLYYYPETHMAYDEDLPASVTRGGVSYPLRQYLAHTTMAEIGDQAQSRREAVKAQIVAAYTFVRRHGFSVSAGSIAYTSKQPTNLIWSCVDDVMGQYLAYADGSTATGLFAASCPSWTASAKSAWGGGNYTGLEGGLYSPEKVSVRTVTMTAQDIITIANTYNEGRPNDQKIHLTGDPSTWLEIEEHDGAYSSNIGYVTRLRIGDRTMSGSAFRTLLFRVSGVPGLRCHCFSLRSDMQPRPAETETETET